MDSMRVTALTGLLAHEETIALESYGNRPCPHGVLIGLITKIPMLVKLPQGNEVWGRRMCRTFCHTTLLTLSHHVVY